MPYGITQCVTCHPAAVTFPPLRQPKLVLNLATPERCKNELAWWWLYAKIVYPRNMVTYISNNRTVSWLGIEIATESRKFIVLTTRPTTSHSAFKWTGNLLIDSAYIDR